MASMHHMVMTDQTNPRKVYTTGGSRVVSIPKDWGDEHGIELGDKFRLEPTDHGFKAVKVELVVSSDD